MKGSGSVIDAGVARRTGARMKTPTKSSSLLCFKLECSICNGISKDSTYERDQTVGKKRRL